MAAQSAGDHRRAVQLYELACDGGSATGCAMLGILYWAGRGSLAEDHGRAAELFHQGCDGGFARACTHLGEIHANWAMFPRRRPGAPQATDYSSSTQRSRNSEEDQRRAVELYRQGCDGGHGNGCTRLGVLYGQGQSGLVEDTQRAAQLYRQACDGGDAEGCYSLGLSYGAGSGGLAKDDRRALELHRQACDGGFDRACEWLSSRGGN